MSQRTSIEWTDVSWNPLRGCTRVSEGCRNCYAERVAARFSAPGRPFDGVAKMTSKGPRWTGKIVLAYEHIGDPLHWREPRRVFVNSMSDLFHEQVPNGFIDEVFAVMAITPQHTYQVLTKRPERMREYLSARWEDLHSRWAWHACAIYHALHPDLDGTQVGELMKTRAPGWPLSNVWLGTSVEHQEAADERIPHLVATPAAVRFLSCEPLLAPVNVERWLTPTMRVSQGVPPDQRKPLSEDTRRALNALGRAAGKMHGMAFVDWVICGGESGHGARPMDLEWALDLRAQCGFAGVPFFMKQLGGFPQKRADPAGWPEDLRVREMPGQVLA